MSPDVNQSPETPANKPTITESVDHLIQKKKIEREQEGREAVAQQAEGVQTEVAEVMAGVEKPKEKVSERKGESGEKSDLKATGGGSDEGIAVTAAMIRDEDLPSEEVMVRKVRMAINAQIAHEWKKAKKLSGQLLTGGAQEYSSTIAKIRQLKEVLASLLTQTFSFIKDMYLKYFTPDGKRRPMEEIQ